MSASNSEDVPKGYKTSKHEALEAPHVASLLFFISLSDILLSPSVSIKLINEKLRTSVR